MLGRLLNRDIDESKVLREDEKGVDELLGLSPADALARLETTEKGLSSEEAERRLVRYGKNEIIKRKQKHIAVDLLSHFWSPLIIILMIAGGLLFIVGETLDATIIFFMILLSVVMDFYQEYKANRAADMLKEKVTTETTIMRNGVKEEVKNSEIVPGDVFHLSAGDIVPADARLITAKDLFMNQSALTGESYPAEKNEGPINAKGMPVTEWKNYLFMGTSVVSGMAEAVVVKTAHSTEYGKIAKKLMEKDTETEFEKGIKSFGFLIMRVTFVLVLFVFLINTMFKHPALQSFLFAVTLAVGLTPELLPVIISINLSKGAVAMSKKGVIVKRMSAIQNLGSMDILCADKTGTLTENRITLILHINADGREDDKVLDYSFLNSFYQTGIRSPLDEAILNHEKVRADPKEYQKKDEIPFDFIRKRISTIVSHEKQVLMISKGASEEIIKICSGCEINGNITPVTAEVHKKLEDKYYELSSQGFRALAVSYKVLKDEKQAYTEKDEADMIFLGFVTFVDPPKASVRESIKLLRDSGVEMKILTGDNEIVTKKICERIEIEIKGVVLGEEIDKMNNVELSNAAERANVFARLTPSQKERIIKALKFKGHVVGYLGDGINDAPPLRKADVSISVDNAVDVAKSSADIILSDKDLTVLKNGVLEGRKTFGNTMKYIIMATSSNFGNMFSLAAASMFLPFLPMLPIQIILNNFLYDLSQSTIATDNVDTEYIEKPKKIDVSFISNFMLVLGPISTIFDFMTFFLVLNLFEPSIQLFQTAWFMESLLTQTLVILIIRTRLPFYKSKPSKLLLVSSLLISLTAVVLPFTPLGPPFKFVKPPLTFFALLGGILVAYLVIVEIVKRWFYKKFYYQIEQKPKP